ncbi:uncharacterized protein SCHCODRAFT_02516749 [Schizophyllum commune H4-8]|uniref:uncharacterized protein n=1 Tax=Schizophyllum commune (strain H4-8 / FGSC 9210) TaxID=578458 RepID=UPI0021607B73|nr:uncharacterized protein SCHCODRAFT_02519940 [Schizophyllum commune H4-8]XP_050197774.1 uncharacterized protein SCHCODRAFT_02517975 [Schizophyllum commune H4-8]XP_050198049.1 uncharacterized protein SCHCODRAFT_02516749 [Schizophyllum commune H4-8]KAI5885752.1 hypothetical protein SCHCODRAFT_02519940 [Schizophyllum commune H4-8]KAI5886724.1 hypothetical protein SCHCODRAFT_02517975 [Schizophyllum commune H4-8]KAI5887366.1 hypothetical protein SCHCODRAFT_02516749 [Schizophyllum commune H4-8]
MSAGEPDLGILQHLSLELQLLIIENSCPQAVACLSETCKRFAWVSRRWRLHTLKITSRGLPALQHWLEKECDGRSCQCQANTRAEFNKFVRVLLLPKEWSTECRAYLALLAAMAPLRLSEIAASCMEDDVWWQEANKAWKKEIGAEVFASAAAISFRNPSRNGLLSVFKMRLRSMHKEVADLPCTLKLTGCATGYSQFHEWGQDDWNPTAGDEEDEYPGLERICLRVKSLTVDIGGGIEDIIANVYFFDLEDLNVRTRGRGTEWHAVGRLLRDAKKLKTLRLRRGITGRWSQLESDFLPALESLHVDWTQVPCISGAPQFTVFNKVTLYVHKYDADHALDADYEEAKFILSHEHWREIVFVEDWFWKLPALPVPFKPFLLKEQLLAFEDPEQLYPNAVQAVVPDWKDHAAAEALRVVGPWGVLRPPETDGAVVCDNDIYLHVLEPFASAWGLSQPIDWVDIAQRLKILIPEIQAILDDKNTEHSRPSAHKLLSYKFFERASPGLKVLPAVARYTQHLKGSIHSASYTGYTGYNDSYGPRGMRLLRQFLVTSFTDATDLQDEITSAIYVSHLAVRLVMGDMKWEGDLGMMKAWLLILETQQFGEERDARTLEDPPNFLSAFASMAQTPASGPSGGSGSLEQDGLGVEPAVSLQTRKSTRLRKRPPRLSDSDTDDTPLITKKTKVSRGATRGRGNAKKSR